MARLAAITYDGLPISSGGAHKLRTRGFVAGLKAVQSFASAVSLDPIPKDCAVEVLEGNEVPKEFTQALSSKFDARYIRRPSRAIGDHTGHQWEIEAMSLNQIVQELETLRPTPQTGYAGPAVLVHATWNLVFTDSERKPLPYQNKEHYLEFEVGYQLPLGQSLVYSRIAETTTASLIVSLPFEEVSADAKRLAGEIQTHFPCRLSSKHWKIWRLTKKGDSYVGRKIPGLI